MTHTPAMTDDARAQLRALMHKAARILREWAGDRQRLQDKWTRREQEAVECAISLEQASLVDPAGVTPSEAEQQRDEALAGWQSEMELRHDEAKAAEQQIADLTRKGEAREEALRMLAEELWVISGAQSVMSTARAYKRCAEEVESLLALSSPADNKEQPREVPYRCAPTRHGWTSAVPDWKPRKGERCDCGLIEWAPSSSSRGDATGAAMSEHEPVYPECGHKTPMTSFCAACYAHDWQRKVWNLRADGETPALPPKDAAESPAPQMGAVRCDVSEIRGEEDNSGPLESTDLFVAGRGVSLLVNVKTGESFTYSLIVDGKIQQSGEVGGTDRSPRVSGEEKDAARDWSDEDFNHFKSQLPKLDVEGTK